MGLNYFYDTAGGRIAGALRERGHHAEVHTLPADPNTAFDWCLFVNIFEILVVNGKDAAAMERVRRVRGQGRQSAMVLLDCAQTHWFRHACFLTHNAGITHLFDLGFHDQSEYVAAENLPLYRFVFNGLTGDERAAIDAAMATDDAEQRTIPWVFVGHATPERARAVARLVREVDPGGFVYLPYLAPFTEGGPHLNERQMHTVLARARYQIWCSHHDYFYLESERFRQSLLAGAVP